jgi:hypothetical protein
MRTTITAIVVVASLHLPVKGPAQSTVPWSAIDMGFAVSSSPTTMLKSAVGQPFVGTLQGGGSIIETGFLADTLLRTVITSVADQGEIPKEYALQQNYPNPFNPSTTIRLELPHSSQVSLKVYNTLGQEVTTLVDEEKAAGVYDVRFDARNLASGMYVYRLKAGDFVAAKRLLLLR